MKKRVVQWLFFVICCNIVLLHCSLCETAFVDPSKADDDDQGHHLKPFMMIKGKQLKNVYKSPKTLKGLQETLDELRVRDDVKEKKVIMNHNRKGKGSYGGGDLLRPRGKRNAAKSSLLNSSSLLSVVLRYGILALLPPIFFF